MLLNAHTTTRSFRELQFDLKAFLEAFSKIIPLDELSDEGLVEIKWADGSVDMVPTFRFITEVVHNRFPELLIGENAELISGKSNAAHGGTYYTQMLTLFFKRAGLSARVRNLVGPEDDLKFVKGVIRSITADTLTLGDGIMLSSLKVLGVLSAESCSADNSEFSYIESERVRVFDSCDLSKITYTGNITIPFISSHNLSQLEYVPYSNNNDRAWSYCYVNGTASCGNYDDATIETYQRYRAKVYFELPSPYYLDIQHIFWNYAQTLGESIPLTNDTKFAEYTDANILLLYPKKQRINYFLSNGYDKYFRVLPPSSDDNNAIISIRNISSDFIHAVNAWRFEVNSTPVDSSASQSISSSTGKTGSIVPLSYINLPPFSAVEFLLQHKIVGQSLQVYLLPMCALSEIVED